jgi:hypothetical protein
MSEKKMTKKEFDKISEKIHKELLKNPEWKAYEQGFNDGIKFERKRSRK